MAKLDIPRTRDLLQQFNFQRLFIEELGWSQPGKRQSQSVEIKEGSFEQRQIAQLSGVAAIEIASESGNIPDAKTRRALHKEISKHHHENLLIFLDRQRTQSLWYWVKREDKKSHPREHVYVKGQPGDLFLSKLNSMVFELSEFEQSGRVTVVEVARRLKEALDIEQVTKKFYKEFYEEHLAFLELIRGIDDERDRRWYASVLLNRLMFIYFLQRKHFIDNGDTLYLQHKLEESRKRGGDRFYSEFLRALFFEGFAKPEEQRSQEARILLGKIKYLNGGLFLPHPIEERWPRISISDQAFDNLFNLFGRYSWNLNDTPGGEDNEINPDVLGYIFEKYINQKAFGAYYTRPEITDYLCEQTIDSLILNRISDLADLRFDSLADLLINLDAGLCRRLLLNVLPSLSILDPACGSGAFLVAAMKRLINIYSAAIGKIEFLTDNNLTHWLKTVKRDHQNIAYFIKKQIISDNLFGVDIMEEATEIAKLRLFLVLVASATTIDQLEPLPNIDFNILTGNSLIGLMHVDDDDYNRRYAQGNLFRKSYREVLDEKNRLIDLYRHATIYSEDLHDLRNKIQFKKAEALTTLNNILLDDFNRLGIKFEQATWDEAKRKEGKAKKRALKLLDIEELRPFHWGYEFDGIINKRGGFDLIITNPPWDVFQTDEKEFFQMYIPTIQKNKLSIGEWQKQHVELMKDSELREAWLNYAGRFPHVSKYFKTSPQYRNQISIVNGRNVGSKINLYSYFVEQCFNLLRPDGQCGLVIPSGIYTDLGTKQLREMLFSQTQISGLCGFENRKNIFEGVDSRFKFVVLTFAKSGATEVFPAAFMKQDVEELDSFPEEGSLPISVEFIRHLSPESLSLLEFKNEIDIYITEKTSKFPPLNHST